jgi:predicted nucleotidyltransferase
MRSSAVNRTKRNLQRSNILQRAKTIIRSFLPDSEIVVYGSRARGDASSESDWDLLILTEQEVTQDLEESLWDLLYPIEIEHGEVISAFVKNRQEWSTPHAKASPYHQSIDREGIAI